VGPDLLKSPVPLEELSCYQLVYESPAVANVAGKQLPEVKIFEYVKSGES